MKDLALSGMTMIVVTHEMNFAREVANTLYFLDGGIIEESGHPEKSWPPPSPNDCKAFFPRSVTLGARSDQCRYGSSARRSAGAGPIARYWRDRCAR